MRRRILFATMLFMTVAAITFLLAKYKNTHALAQPLPTEGEENEELREKYEELRHRAAPGVEWKLIEAANAQNASRLASNNTGMRTMENFANGAISGTWNERGAANQTGNIRAVDYVPATNNLYTVSNGGSLWRSTLGSGSWSILNQSSRYDGRIMRAFTKLGGGTRLMVSTGQQVLYSDNEGATFTPSSGIVFPVAWSSNYVAQIIRLNDGSNTVYCLTRPWSASPWGPRFWLYQSTDEGASFTKIYEFAVGDDDRISLCNPYNTTALYAADIYSAPGNLRLYNIVGNTVNLPNSYALGLGNVGCLLKGTQTAGVTTLYLMTNNSSLYCSTDLGVSWTLRSNLPESAWMKMNVSMNNADAVSFGGVNAYRSSDGGTSFTKVNDWSDYYSNTSGKLHADIMEIEYFKKADNTEFAIIDTHGGSFVSYNNLANVSNQSLSSHYATEYYDVLTDTINRNRIFVGTQDQGMQRTLNGTTAGLQNFQQVISGDFGQMALSGNNQFLWPQYPGGTFYRYTNLGNAGNPQFIGTWSMSGTQKPNYGWMLPVTSTADVAANEVWMGGGNITGGGGSFLVKLSMATSSPYTVTPTQLPYDFRANSNSTTAGITAIEQSALSSNKLYVATEDGTFFYSTDLGVNWNKTASFNGPVPWYLYGSCILASRKDPNLVWYSGSGYSNPPVYVSTNGGASFSSMSNGLPPTLVNEMVATPAEDFLFAATDAGPYVYVMAAAQWFPLISNNVPTQFFSSVEYIRAENTVRFGTMGRGIWDFMISLPVILPVNLVQFDAVYRSGKGLLSWTTSAESNSSHFVVERSLDGVVFNAIGNMPAGGNSTNLRRYSFTDDLQSISNGAAVYYRLQQVDLNGVAKASGIVKIKMPTVQPEFTLLYNPVQTQAVLRYESNRSENMTVRLYDAVGKLMRAQTVNAVIGTNQFYFNTSGLASGVYILELQNSVERRTVRMVKK